VHLLALKVVALLLAREPKPRADATPLADTDPAVLKDWQHVVVRQGGILREWLCWDQLLLLHLDNCSISSDCC